MCEDYNGWVNRETWAMYLWMTSDEFIYSQTGPAIGIGTDEAAKALAKTPELAEWEESLTRTYVGDALRDMWESVTDPEELFMDPTKILTMTRDIGSEYRVNWNEIARHFLDV